MLRLFLLFSMIVEYGNDFIPLLSADPVIRKEMKLGRYRTKKGFNPGTEAHTMPAFASRKDQLNCSATSQL